MKEWEKEKEPDKKKDEKEYETMEKKRRLFPDALDSEGVVQFIYEMIMKEGIRNEQTGSWKHCTLILHTRQVHYCTIP
jgi:hypothetical protein